MDVVPVQVGEDDRPLERPPGEQVGDAADPGPRVEDQPGRLVPMGEREARRVPAGPDEFEPGAGVEPRTPQKMARTTATYDAAGGRQKGVPRPGGHRVAPPHRGGTIFTLPPGSPPWAHAPQAWPTHHGVPRRRQPDRA